MKALRSLVIIVHLLTVSLLMNAQTLTNRQQRHMNMRLLDLVEKYELYSTAYDKAAVYSFVDLFESEDSKVYNDMLEYPETAVSVKTYVNNLSKQENIGVVMKNVGHGAYYFEDGAWHSIVTFEKSLSYNDAKGVLFSSEEYYGKDYTLSLDCKYDSAKDRFVIVSVTGVMSSDVKHLPENFDVIEHNTPNDDKLSVGGKPLKFNSFGQAFSKRNGIQEWNDDVRISRNVLAVSDNYELVKLNFKFTRFRAKAKFACTAGSAFKVDSPVKFDENKSFGFEAGVDLGYAIPMGKRVTMSIFTGLAYSASKLNLAVGGYDYAYQTTGYGGQIYTRNYHIEKLSEGLSYSDIVVPLYLSFDFKLTSYLLLGVDVGAKMYANMGINRVPYHVKATVSGTFAEGSQAAPEDALGDIDSDYSAFLFPISYKGTVPGLSITGGLSLSCNVYKRLVYVYAKVDFEYGLTNVYKSVSQPLFVENEFYPIVYSPHYGGKNVATQSLWRSISYKRQAIWPEIGVMFKF